MKFSKILCVSLVMGACHVDTGLAQGNAPFSIYKKLSREDSHKVFFALEYLLDDDVQIDSSIVKKARTIRPMMGSPSTLPNPGGTTPSKFIRSKKTEIFARYQGNKTALRDDVKRSAEVVGDRFEPETKKIAAHLFDLAVSLDPTNVELAYQSETFSVTNQINLAWLESGKKVYRFVVQEGPTQDDSGVPIRGLKQSQALIKGLLVQELRGSQFLGEASQMNATVIRKGSTGDEMTVTYNQKVGESMTQAAVDIMAFHRKRQPKLPTGISVEISFEEQYIPKDGPSAGVAGALLVESLFEGHRYDRGFAVTGAMNGEGKVGAVGGVDGKIRGAITRNCTIVAIPLHNEATIRDLLILEGPASLAKIQVIGITVFEDALKLALEDQSRDPKIKTALATFDEVQKLLNQRGGMGYLPNPKVQGKLRSVVQAIPTHFSAKYLLLKAMGRNPSSLSLIGSVQAIDRNAAPLIRSLENGDFEEDKLGKDNFGKTIGNLSRVRPQLDTRCRPCADAIVDYAGYIRKAINSWPNSRRAQQELVGNIKRSGTKVGQEYDHLFDREDVKKELLQD